MKSKHVHTKCYILKTPGVHNIFRTRLLCFVKKNCDFLNEIAHSEAGTVIK